MTSLAWRDPWMLALALGIPLALALRRRRSSDLRFAPSALLGSGRRAWRPLFVPLPRALEVLGLLCAVLALARPVHRTSLVLPSEGIDIVLSLDVSSSMTEEDMTGGGGGSARRTRLDVVRDAAVRFVERRPSDRIGLVAFARYPDLLCPPTPDHDALERILAEVATVPSDSPEDATGIGAAVARAAEVLRESPSRSRVVVLLTDGEENVATTEAPGEIAPAHAAQLCERFGVRVYAVIAGVGRRAPGGTWARPDTRAVGDLARRTGGELFEAPDAAAMEAVYGRIDALEKTPFEEPRTVLEDRFLPFLFAALGLLLLGRLLESTVLDVLP